ncbi:2-hydroxyacid dehydrogenase [Thalassotalea sp. LPB0316]|uniref:2-hydroxyacid dehydrogenase n=1 Tax=Thalassotalea sp. LPB0316 TaxID=2769490 RepID=UPI001866FDC6|nr:2-hydroxyacid dehydrogenase [Thalassotalea sp. LPB0316]QOL26450.1 2-hydroxyacid dehydrogenase [Thalassotalea sp. LPB0316]
MNKVAVFSSKKYDRIIADSHIESSPLAFTFFESALSEETVHLAQGFDAICIFVNDEANRTILEKLKSFNITVIALRCAGYNNVDIKAADELGFTICRVPEYSPEAVAEHTVGLMLTLSRKFHKAYNRIREGNFALDGLMGFNLYQKTVGLIGTGNIGIATLKILKGFGCHIICSDPVQNPEAIALGAKYIDLNELFQQSDIISLHCPLLPPTYHIIDESAVNNMKKGVMIINTSRGALIDTKAVTQGLKSGQIGYLGLDVYELESGLFFEDLSEEIIQDDVFQRLTAFNNVMITGHQGFFTSEALNTIARTTINNLQTLLSNQVLDDEFIIRSQ